MDERNLLCLKCRQCGHTVDGCPQAEFNDLKDWMFSQQRLSMDFKQAWDDTESTTCDRCAGLDLLDILSARPPWKTQQQLSDAFENGHHVMRNLGKVGSIRFHSECMLCRCLFAMVPNPASPTQEVILLPDWTLNRLAGEDGVCIDNDVKARSATCLVVILKPNSSSLSIPVVAHRGEALCLSQDSIEDGRSLGGRRIDQTGFTYNTGRTVMTGSRVSMARAWIDACSNRHSESCSPIQTPDLDQIRLLGVENRRIVAFPTGGTDYLALSYVWGQIEQPSFGLGADLRKEILPKTIEDAIQFTKDFGKDYLWVDSICINQADDDDKRNQIDRMWSIYRGAFVTLLALSSSSAHDGISRLGRQSKYTQMSCGVDGKRLVGLMPTLSHQIWVCPWGQRAWTLQEALLSPRCLYFSDHQVHFECEGMQCCESLDETSSGVHGLSISEKPESEPFVTWITKHTGPGCLRVDSRTSRIDQYGRKLTLYSFREMSNNADGLHAFCGVLQKLTTLYSGGWYEGLPIEDLDWALLWRLHIPALAQRRNNFPSWSWAEWKGRIWHGRSIDVTNPRRFPVHLVMYKVQGDKQVKLFQTHPTPEMDADELCITITNDPIDIAWKRQGSQEPMPVIEDFSRAESRRYLIVDAILLQCALDFSDPFRWSPKAGEEALFRISIEEVKCFIGIMALDLKTIQKPASDLHTLVLLAREYAHGFLIHHLMLIQQSTERGIYERATVVQLWVPLDQLQTLHVLQPVRRTIVLS